MLVADGYLLGTSANLGYVSGALKHEFELAFNLLDEAASRIQDQQYGITGILFHNHGDILLTTVHDYIREAGHRLVLLAGDDDGQMVAVEATAPDLETNPVTRILKVRAGALTFHAIPGTWSYRATTGEHTYTLTAGVGDEPAWVLTVADRAAVAYEHLYEAIDVIAEHEPVADQPRAGPAHKPARVRPLARTRTQDGRITNHGDRLRRRPGLR